MAAGDGRATLLVLGAAVLFGTTGTAQALGPDSTTPLTVGAARIVVGGALLLALLLVTAGAQPLRRLSLVPVAVGALAVAVYQPSFFAAVDRTGVAVGAVVALGSAPAFTGLLGLLVLRERPRRPWGAATALAIAGVALLALAGGDAEVDPVGVLLAACSGLGYSVFAIASSILLRRGAIPDAVTAAQFGLGGLILLPLLLTGDAGWLGTGEGLALALWLGIGPTALAYALFTRGLRHLPPATVSTLTLAEPVTATILGVLVLDERPGLQAAAGCALILIGLLVLARPAGADGKRGPAASS